MPNHEQASTELTSRLDALYAQSLEAAPEHIRALGIGEYLGPAGVPIQVRKEGTSFVLDEVLARVPGQNGLHFHYTLTVSPPSGQVTRVMGIGRFVTDLPWQASYYHDRQYLNQDQVLAELDGRFLPVDLSHGEAFRAFSRLQEAPSIAEVMADRPIQSRRVAAPARDPIA